MVDASFRAVFKVYKQQESVSIDRKYYSELIFQRKYQYLDPLARQVKIFSSSNNNSYNNNTIAIIDLLMKLGQNACILICQGICHLL